LRPIEQAAPFRLEDCTCLVFYAVHDEPDEYGPISRPCVVDARALVEAFRDAVAPRWINDTVDDVRAHVEDALRRRDLDDETSRDLHRLRVWLGDCLTPYVAYELEPPRLAGTGLARLIGLEAESALG
jgi:hypothetical protein